VNRDRGAVTVTVTVTVGPWGARSGHP